MCWAPLVFEGRKTTNDLDESRLCLQIHGNKLKAHNSGRVLVISLFAYLLCGCCFCCRVIWRLAIWFFVLTRCSLCSYMSIMLFLNLDSCGAAPSTVAPVNKGRHEDENYISCCWLDRDPNCGFPDLVVEDHILGVGVAEINQANLI